MIVSTPSVNHAHRLQREQEPKLWDVQVTAGKRVLRTIAYGVPYAVAIAKRKEEVSKGTFLRNVWIVKAGTK